MSMILDLISFIYTVTKDLLSYWFGRGRSLKPEQVLELRQKWKPEFERVIWEKTKKGHGLDVIIRDVKRVDIYPDVPEGKGISPWFKVGLMGTYERGILAGLAWQSMVKDEVTGEWRETKPGETSDTPIMQIGKIPYESIEAVDWRGDDFYSNGQIYCHFAYKKRQPYEYVGMFFERQMPGGPTFYTEVTPLAVTKPPSRWFGWFR